MGGFCTKERMDTTKETSPADGPNVMAYEQPASMPTDKSFEEEINAAPLHLNAVRTPAKLEGSSSQNSLKAGTALTATMSRSRSSSRSRQMIDTTKTTSPADGSNVTLYEQPASMPTDKSFEEEINAAPLHLNAVRTPARLQGSSSQSSLKAGTALTATMSRSRSSSRSRPSSRPTSRDVSPCSSDIASGIILSRVSSTASSTGGDLDSSITLGAVQINIDPDILLDRLGMDTSPTMNDSCNSLGSIKFMPCLNERMSEESLDDCHAFTDLKNVIRQIPSASAGPGGSDPARSRDGSVAGGSILGDSSCLLETLKEFEEESDGGDETNASGGCEEEGEIPALGLEIKSKMSLNDTDEDELGMTCKEIEIDCTERGRVED